VLLVLIVLLIGGAMVLDEIYLHKGALEYAETQAEKWSDDIEEQAEQWAEELEENLRESFGDAEKKHGFGSNISYGQANSYTAGDADIVSDRIQQLQIEWLSGSVTVKPYDGSTVQIKETGADAPEEQLRWLLSDSKLTVQYAAEGHYLQLPAKDLTVLVPAGKSFDRISIQSVSAEADLQDIEARQLSLQSTSGDLSAVGSFHEAEIHTISGEVSFRGVSADIEVETTSGDAAVTLTETPDEFSFDGVSGDLKLWVPENRGFELEHDTVSGSFSCALSTTQTDKNTLRFAGSGPAASLNLETVSGNLTISVFKE